MKKTAWMIGVMTLVNAACLWAGDQYIPPQNPAVPEMPPGFAPYAIAGMFGLLMVIRRFLKK